MPTVVLDTNVILPGLLSPGGMRRKLLVLLAFGAVSRYVHVGYGELDAMDALTEEHPGAQVGGLPVEALVEHAANCRTLLEEFLPAVTPDVFTMAACPLLFDELEEKILTKGHIWGVTPGDARTYRRALLSITPQIVHPYTADEVRDYGIADPADNFLVHSAVEAQAEFVISDDKKVAPDGGPVEIECPETGRVATAFQVMDFVEEHVNTSNFDLAAVRGDLLVRAFPPLVSTGITRL